MSDHKKIKLAFICSGNSARSQIAEGLARALGGDQLLVQSAGLSPMGVAKKSIAVMAEVGIDISDQWSKGLDELDSDLDYAITLCDHADRNCPVLPAKTRIHWSIPDPHNLRSINDQLAGFREVRAMLKIKISEFLKKEGLLASVEK
ncbi:MAG: arsenate reductase ArsC [Phycisphaerae bacterium]